MKLTSTIARILLGLMFVAFGLNGFLWFMKAPPMTGPVQLFMEAAMTSHFVWFYSGVQVIAGAMFLFNRFVPLAIVVTAAVIANILAFHIIMFLVGIPPGILVAILWFLVAWPLRAHFAPLFVARTSD